MKESKKLLTERRDGKISVTQARRQKEHYRTIVHTWRARRILNCMFPFLWELFCGKDHKTKKLIARNLRAWSHSLFEVFINMSRIFSQWKRVKKLLTKTHDGRISVAQARKPKEQYRTSVHTWTARHVLNFMCPLLWELLCGKDHKTKN